MQNQVFAWPSDSGSRLGEWGLSTLRARLLYRLAMTAMLLAAGLLGVSAISGAQQAGSVEIPLVVDVVERLVIFTWPTSLTISAEDFLEGPQTSRGFAAFKTGAVSLDVRANVPFQVHVKAESGFMSSAEGYQIPIGQLRIRVQDEFVSLTVSSAPLYSSPLWGHHEYGLDFSMEITWEDPASTYETVLVFTASRL